ncbi:MAG: zinc ABC transporter substrate-binding protein [Acidimicrobiales bacterium]|jgi:zinc/manganese transport system substrate-binding protein
MLGVLACVMLALTGAACASSAAAPKPGAIDAVGAENEYANVLSQIGGRYVNVTAIMSNPNTDPHTFEASPQVAEEVSAAELVIQNGVGYDTFMNKIEAASPDSGRKVIDVQSLLGLPDSTANPHLWYNPVTMPAVAKAVATDLAELQPAHAAYFHANARSFLNSLAAWSRALATLKAEFPGAPVAVTEPVADYMLQAAGMSIRTPWSLQADIMNGVDVSPQNVSFEENLFARHEVKAFLYNEQVTDSVTQTFLALAKQAGIPVVAVYETMPTPGYDYQTWMVAEVTALQRALAAKVSTDRL